MTYAYDYNATSEPGKIIPFPHSSSSSVLDANIERLLINTLSNPEIENHFKGIVEGAIMDAWVKSHYRELARVDNPFDAVYISELKADAIVPADLNRITDYANITDLSETIIIDDEWDD